MAYSLEELNELMTKMKEHGVVMFKQTFPDGSALKMVVAPPENTSAKGIWVNEAGEEAADIEDKQVGFSPYSKFNLQDYK